jgi:formylglycine-generating enzyme required for sulfatase activity
VSVLRACIGAALLAVVPAWALFARSAAAQPRMGTSSTARPGAPPPAWSNVTTNAAPTGEEEPPPEDEPSASASASASAAPPVPSAIPGAPGKPRPAVQQKDGMLRLPGGRFLMGSLDPKAPPNERPAHLETVAPFWIDRTEVTVGAYAACVDKHVCRAPAKSSATCTFEMGDPLLPMSCVHFADAEAYCRGMGKRLPREVEWEYAARGTGKAAFPWGGSVSGCYAAATLRHDATGRTCTGTKPARVGTHPLGASPFGVLDMCGNVEEWTSDWYAESVANGATPTSGASHTLRGGGWLSTPSMSKTTSRNWGSVVEAGANVGFRCARDATE